MPQAQSRQDRVNGVAVRDSMVFVSAGSEDSHGSAGEADELEDTGGDEVAPQRNYARRATAILQVNNIEL